jgi:hypothetical protein
VLEDLRVSEYDAVCESTLKSVIDRLEEKS